MTRIEDVSEDLETSGPAPRHVNGRLVRILGSGPSPARVRVALLVVVMAFVALGSFVAAKTPAWESADEPGHVLNIETLVSGHWYRFDQNCRPNPTYTILSCQGDEAQQAPLYYLLMAGWQDLAGLSAHNPPNRLTFNSHYASAQPFFLTHTADWDLLIWLRIGNVLMGAATVLMAFVIARLVARDKWTPVIAAALIAFLPRFVFFAAFVTNDNLVILLGAILTFCALRFSRSRTTQWMVATGVVFGLLLSTKLTTFPLALIVPLLAVIGASTWRRRLSLFVYGSLSALAVSAWYFVQNWVRYGDPTAHAQLKYITNLGALGTPPGVPYVIKDPAKLVLFDVPNRIVSNVWYSSGWGQYHWPQAVEFLIAVVVVLSFLGLIYQKFPPRTLLILGAISILSLACVWFMALQTPAYGERYAFVGVAAIATLFALAVQPWPLVLRWVLPLAGFAGCLVAIHQNVLGVHWS